MKKVFTTYVTDNEHRLIRFLCTIAINYVLDGENMLFATTHCCNEYLFMMFSFTSFVEFIVIFNKEHDNGHLYVLLY